MIDASGTFLLRLEADSIVHGVACDTFENEAPLSTEFATPFRNDRQCLLDATDILISVLETVRQAREMQWLRGDLTGLLRNAERVRRVVDHQPPLRGWFTPCF
jgi:hypothetical protein